MNLIHWRRSSRSGQPSHAGLVLRPGQIFALASVLAVAPMVAGFPPLSSSATAHPVKGHLRVVGFVASPVASMRAARGATASAASTPGAPDPITTAAAGALSPVQDVAGAVTVVGVTWPKNALPAHDQFQIRTLAGATWSQWQPLDIEPADGPDPARAAGATSGTSPFIVTGASKYQVRTLSTNPTAMTQATIHVVDPGTSAADSLQQAPGGAAAAATKPVIYSRAAWGADESIRAWDPSYGKIAIGFVHHTVSSNYYSPSEVPAMIRGIYSYHTQTLGWGDIGYNFLIDRFGRTWEGRYGGISRPTIGAHTFMYNSVSMGVSAIGNFDVAPVPQAMTDAFKRIFAWKFTLAGIPANGTVPGVKTQSWSTARYFQRISGHRDANQDICPGRYLYAKLPEIRAGAAALMATRQPPPVRTPPPPPKAPAPAGNPAATRYTPYKGAVLAQGSHGAAVVVLQGAFHVSADGAFGPMTRAALVTYQKQQHLPANGIANGPVWNRLEARDYPLIAYRRFTLRQGSRGGVVAVLQRALRVAADGDFGPKTAAAVRSDQASARLAPTGVVSGWTWVAIESRMR
jgi:peptidoglycan hydrolase-like protein with peptidoglycan-binding domain